MTAQDQQSRAAFEQSAQKIWPEMNIVRGHYGGYLDFNTHDKWLMWQAARALPDEDLQDLVSKALRRAWQLGQTYWQQADSESYIQNRKSDETQVKFQELVEETRSVLATAQVQAVGRVPPGWQELMKEARDNCMASIAEVGVSDSRIQYRKALLGRLDAALAAAPRPPAAQGRKPLTCLNFLEMEMIDLKELRQRATHKYGASAAEVLVLLDMLDAAKIDAARYQWLRHGGIDNLPHSNFGDGPVYDEIDALDHYIDAAMAATEGEEA